MPDDAPRAPTPDATQTGHADEPASVRPTARQAGRSAGSWVWLVVVVLVGLGADLGTKSWAFARIADQPVTLTRSAVLGADHLGDLLPPHQPVVVIPGVLELTLVLNPGAVFGLGAGARWFFIAFTAVAIAFLLWMFARLTRPRDWFAHAAIGLLIAGGLGNLYDRLVFACVRDFLHPLPHTMIPGTDRPLWPYVSNVADAYLIIGIIGLLVLSWRSPNAHRADPEQAEAPAPTNADSPQR